MYFLLGLEKNLETIAVLTKSFLTQSHKYASLLELKEAYFSFLKVVQRKDKFHLTENIQFVQDEDLFSKLIKLFLGKKEFRNGKISGYDFKKIDDKSLIEIKFSLIKESLDLLKQANFDYFFLSQLLFSHIILVHSNAVTCASNPIAMGLLLMNHKIWSVEDICEMFIHETAHQLVSLDEYRYEHYNNYLEIKKPENYAISAIRKTKRPMNKTIHSLIVAFEIFMYRISTHFNKKKIKVHPESKLLKTQIIETIESISEKEHLKNLLTPRTNLFLDTIKQEIQKF